MKKNMGTIDKLIRVIIAVVIGVLYYQGLITNSTVAIALLFLAIILLITSLLNFCPLYLVFRLRTTKKNLETAE